MYLKWKIDISKYPGSVRAKRGQSPWIDKTEPFCFIYSRTGRLRYSKMFFAAEWPIVVCTNSAQMILPSLPFSLCSHNVTVQNPCGQMFFVHNSDSFHFSCEQQLLTTVCTMQLATQLGTTVYFVHPINLCEGCKFESQRGK